MSHCYVIWLKSFLKSLICHNVSLVVSKYYRQHFLVVLTFPNDYKFSVDMGTCGYICTKTSMYYSNHKTVATEISKLIY